VKVRGKVRVKVRCKVRVKVSTLAGMSHRSGHTNANLRSMPT